MNQLPEVTATVNKILEFSEFFLSLGNMKQAEILISIANRDPEFENYFANLSEPFETAIDFFKVYAGWVIKRICKQNSLIWKDIVIAYNQSDGYKSLKAQCDETPVLWDLLQKIING